MTVKKAKVPKVSTPPSPLQLSIIKPKTINQKKIFDYYNAEKHLFVHGSPGTGKTFLSIYLALNSIEKEEYHKLVIVRSAVPSRKQGFLPGNENEKNEIFELPYISIVDDLFRKRGSYKTLKMNDKINFLSTSYLRGITIDDSVILIDEVQNLNFMELHTIITRIGQNCRVILCGDEFQNDLAYLHEDSCINKLLNVIDRMPSFMKVEMSVNDICRNPLVKEWILANV